MNKTNTLVPPASSDSDELYKFCTTLCTYLNQMLGAGTQAMHYPGAQIDAMTNLEQAGKLFFDQDNGTLEVALVEAGALVIKTVQVA